MVPTPEADPVVATGAVAGCGAGTEPELVVPELPFAPEPPPLVVPELEVLLPAVAVDAGQPSAWLAVYAA